MYLNVKHKTFICANQWNQLSQSVKTTEKEGIVYQQPV